MAGNAYRKPGNIDPQIESDHSDQDHRCGESDRVERRDAGFCQLRGHERSAHRAGHRQTAALDHVRGPADQIIVLHQAVLFVQHDETLVLAWMESGVRAAVFAATRSFCVTSRSPACAGIVVTITTALGWKEAGSSRGD